MEKRGMPKIIYLDHQEAVLTGAHRYNDELITNVSNILKLEIEYTPSCGKRYLSWRKLYSSFFELCRLFVFNKDDIVFWNDTNYKHHFLLSICARLFKRVHSVVIIHHFPYLGRKGILRWLDFLLQYFYYLCCQSIIVPSLYTYDVARKLYPNKKIFYIPLPFEKLYVKSSSFEFGNYLYVGTIEERKGLCYLVKALGLLHKMKPNLSFQLNIVGKIVDSNYYKNLIKIAKEENIEDRLFFRGRVSDKDLEQYYDNAEIFTFPSLLEGFGIVLIESMKKGIPIVAFNNSAMPYTIKDGINGLLAQNKDITSLAGKIMQLTGNSVMRTELQEGMEITISKLNTKEDFENGILAFVREMD